MPLEDLKMEVNTVRFFTGEHAGPAKMVIIGAEASEQLIDLAVGQPSKRHRAA